MDEVNVRNAKAARAEYQREWRKKNPGKTKEYLERYWTKKAAEREAHKDKEV